MACFPIPKNTRKKKVTFRNLRPITRILKLNLIDWYICTSGSHCANWIVPGGLFNSFTSSLADTERKSRTFILVRILENNASINKEWTFYLAVSLFKKLSRYILEKNKGDTILV